MLKLITQSSVYEWCKVGRRRHVIGRECPMAAGLPRARAHAQSRPRQPWRPPACLISTFHRLKRAPSREPCFPSSSRYDKLIPPPRLFPPSILFVLRQRWRSTGTDEALWRPQIIAGLRRWRPADVAGSFDEFPLLRASSKFVILFWEL